MARPSQGFQRTLPTSPTFDVTDAPEAAERATFETMFRSHYQALVGFGARYTGSIAIAEEVVQEVFLAMWRQKATMPPADKIRSYLYRAVHNRALNVVRHERVARTRDAESVEPRFSEPADEKLLREETERLIQAAVDRLPERCRLIFILSREQKLTYAQIAEVAGVSIKTVETQMGRALRSLRNALAGLGR
jgi:RNA polymerase sigma-70 factor (ECF subfamily)